MLFDEIPLAWKAILASHENTINEIGNRLSPDSYNPSGNIFRALELAPEEVKVLVLGQDPYPDAAHAIGLAFAVPSVITKTPPTLKNILKEIEADTGKESTSENLCNLPHQGVLLLNTILTCEKGRSLSHEKYGWQVVTDEIIKHLASRESIAVLWGNHARKYAHHFSSESIVSGVHPSPLSAYRGFFGSKPFSAVNQKLMAKGVTPIKW